MLIFLNFVISVLSISMSINNEKSNKHITLLDLFIHITVIEKLAVRFYQRSLCVAKVETRKVVLDENHWIPILILLVQLTFDDRRTYWASNYPLSDIRLERVDHEVSMLGVIRAE